MNKLLNSTKGKLIYKAQDQNDHEDNYVAPHVFEIKPDDPLMGEEVRNVIFKRN